MSHTVAIAKWVQEVVEGPQDFYATAEFEQIRNNADEAIPALINVIRKEPDVRGVRDDQRMQAYQVLSALGPLAKPAIPFLITGLTTNNYLVEFTCATLPRLGREAELAIPTLKAILHDLELNRVLQEPSERMDVRSRLLFQAANCLSKLDPSSPELIPTMLLWLKSPNIYCRRVAPRVLSQLKQSETSVTRALTQALVDSDETVRQNAAEAIASIASNAGLRPESHN